MYAKELRNTGFGKAPAGSLHRAGQKGGKGSEFIWFWKTLEENG